MSSSQKIEELWKFFPKISNFSIAKKKRNLSAYGLGNDSAKSFFLVDLLQKHKPQKASFVVRKKGQVEEYKQICKFFFSLLPEEERYQIFTFSWDEKKHDQEKYEFLAALEKKQKMLFILTREESQIMCPKKEFYDKKKITLKSGDTLNITDFFQDLSDIGYKVGLDVHLEKGEFLRKGDQIFFFDPAHPKQQTIDIAFDEIESLSQGEKTTISPVGKLPDIQELISLFSERDLCIFDDFEEVEDQEQELFLSTPARTLEIASFPRGDQDALHLRFLSILKFYTLVDFLNDLREKIRNGWKIMLVTKREEEIESIFREEGIPFTRQNDLRAPLALVNGDDLEIIPPSFQNPVEKIAFLTDREIFHLNKKTQEKSSEDNMMEFLTSLKSGDYIVHLDHGIGRFLGIVEQELSGIIHEYLEIEYAQKDKLFVPIEYADKVSRYIADDDRVPKLTRLGSVEWKSVQSKVKKETEKIAKELLKIYALRARASAVACEEDKENMKKFEESFTYVPTPGQMAAIRDIKKDMESHTPMDRLVCGDVGFGKTEVAMRAAFKAVENGMQVAVITPITILSDQHFSNFKKRMEGFDIRVEGISRFKTPAEQKKIINDAKKGKIDILVGTHRLLSDDVGFHNLGLLIIDEEQRFGVQQKEKLKKLRNQVHILTMTATPIPRTLNLALHKLREISTITTPPPGRLPIVTEVRKYSDKLIRDAILTELERGGQIYFLHNRVETIESIAEKLRHLVPEARFGVAHGQMKADQLEQQIYAFKEKEFDVLISSTIIENGIDLANANTMIINKAENFGLSQLYQLRGRIGRSSRQAYAYLLYHSQKLLPDAKKRLRAIVEASELGSGFQLSMRDLEIRGAGDVLGVSQHGSVNAVGVSHFLRLLKQAISDMENDNHRTEDPSTDTLTDIALDLPVSAFIPSFFIPDSKEKILAYQKMASITTLKRLDEYRKELSEEYGKLPQEVKNLFKILELKVLAKTAFVRSVKINKEQVEIGLTKKISAKEVMNLLSVQNFWTVTGESVRASVTDLTDNYFPVLRDSLRLLAPQNK